MVSFETEISVNMSMRVVVKSKKDNMLKKPTKPIA